MLAVPIFNNNFLYLHNTQLDMTDFFALGMGMIADRLVRSTKANAESWTARPDRETPKQ